MIIMPTIRNFSAFSYLIELDLIVYTFYFAFNNREGNWYMSIHDEDDIPIITNFKLVINYDILRDFRAYDIPPGVFIYQKENENVTETADNFGIDFVLNYLTKSEVDEIDAEIEAEAEVL